jgi:magnesium-transporting ATPase (P-type)
MEFLANFFTTSIIQGVFMGVFFICASLERMSYPRHLFSSDRQSQLKQMAIFVLVFSILTVSFILTFASESFIVADRKGRLLAIGISLCIGYFVGMYAKDLGRSSLLWIFLSMFISFPAAFLILTYARVPVTILDAFKGEFNSLDSKYRKKLYDIQELKKSKLVDADDYESKIYLLKEEYEKELNLLLEKQEMYIEQVLNP